MYRKKSSYTFLFFLFNDAKLLLFCQIANVSLLFFDFYLIFLIVGLFFMIMRRV